MGLVVGVLRGLSGRAAWAFDGMHGLSVLRRRTPTKTCRRPPTKTCRRTLVGRPCAAEGIFLDRARRVWCGTAVLVFGRVASLMACMARPCYVVGGAASTGHARPSTARRYSWTGRGRCSCKNFSLPPTPLPVIKFSTPLGGAQRRG